MSDKATISIDGESYDFPVYRGVEDDVCIDIKTLRGASGVTTIDRGFKNTASCESKITYLDGEKGILRYRGENESGRPQGKHCSGSSCGVHHQSFGR